MGLDLHALADAANDLHRIAAALESLDAYTRRLERDRAADTMAAEVLDNLRAIRAHLEGRNADARSDS